MWGWEEDVDISFQSSKRTGKSGTFFKAILGTLPCVCMIGTTQRYLVFGSYCKDECNTCFFQL